MESSWQMKCGSAFQSLKPAVASSTSQDPRNQMEMSSNPHFFPPFLQDLRSTVHGRTQDPLLPSNSSSCGSGYAEMGNSFLALLSGSPSVLQCDFQELSNSKALGTSSKFSVDNTGGVPASAVVTGVPLMSSGMLSENLSNRNLRNGTNLCPVVSSREVVNSNCTSHSVLHNGLQAANLNFQSSELAKAVISHIVPGNVKAKDFSFLKEELFGRSPANSGKLHGTNTQVPPKLPVEATSFVSDQSSTFMSGCPRVFCLDHCGYLLLSNTGLLGIVCSCHFFHMSVSKFCEHSGSFGVNPGDAVRMASGETVAEWRKLYFQKFGIRVLEDQSGWDWAEGLSATAGLVKSSATIPNRSSASDMENSVGSSGGLIRSVQPLDTILSPKVTRRDQNLVIDALHDEQQRSSRDCSNFLPKGLINTSQSNLHAVVDNQILECPMSRCSTVPKFVGKGPDNGFQPASAYINPIVKAGNSSASHPTWQNLSIPCKNYDVNRSKSAKDVVITERDAASSNVELKLGQPYQQSRPSGNSALSVIGPKLLDTLVDTAKSLYLEQMIHNAANCWETGEPRQQFHSAAGPSNSTTTRETSQLNLGNHALGITNVIDASKLDKLGGDVTKSLMVPLVTQFMPQEGCANSKATNKVANISEHIMPKSVHCESHTGKSDPVNVPWNVGNGLERQFNVPDLDFFRLMEKGKGVGCFADGSNTVADSAFKIHHQMENPCSFAGVVGGSSDPIFSAVHDKSYYSRQSCSVPSDAFDTRNFFNQPGNAPSLGSWGHTDHVSLRSTGSRIGSGKILQPQTVSMGFPSATSTSIPGLTPSLLRQESIGVSPYVLDDNMRLLALRQILELSKEHHAISSLGMYREPGTFGSSSSVKVQHSLIDISAARERGPDLTSKQGVSGVDVTALPSGATSTGGNSDKVAPDTGFNNCYNFSSLTQGGTLCSMENYMPAQFLCSPFLNKQAALRLGRNENISQLNDQEKCCQGIPCKYFQGTCSCAAQTKCLGGNCESRIGSSPNSLKQQLGSIKCSVSVASEFANNDITPNERTPSSDQSGKLNGRLFKAVICHASEWRDVPSKQKKACDVKCMDRSADVLDGRGHDEGQLRDTATKCFNGSVQIAGASKEQETSNVSSDPAVTQASVEVNNMDSSTADAGHTGYVDDLIVDEGSGIDKCWSSDDVLESERSAEFLSAKTNWRKEGSSKVLNNQSSRSLLDELKLIDSLTWKKGRNQIHTGLPVRWKTNHSKKIERHLKIGNRKRAMKLKMLDASSLPDPVLCDECPKDSDSFEWPSCSSKDKQMLLPSGQGTNVTGTSAIRPSFNCGRSTLSLAKVISRKRDLHRVCDDSVGDQSESNGSANYNKILEVSGRKKLRRTQVTDSFRKSRMQEQPHEDTERTGKYNLIGSVEPSSSQQVNACYKKARPTVCGKYGEISTGNLAREASKPVKFGSLSSILKTARRCTLPKARKPKLASLRELKNRRFSGSHSSFDRLSNLDKEEEKGSRDNSFCHEMNLDHSIEEASKSNDNGEKQFADELSSFEKEKDHNSKKKCTSILDSNAHTDLRPKFKETRERSLYELAVKGKYSSTENVSLMKISNCMPKIKVGKLSKNADNSKSREHRSCKVNYEKSIQENRFVSDTDSDAFCCVCGSSNNDEVNCLLECSQCLIRVHQACYGVSRIPKGDWYCRPCRTNSKDIVCVLCGYGGGAMTQALRSRTVVKSLLKAWNIDTESRPKNSISSDEILQDDDNMLHSSGSALESDPFHILRRVNAEPSTTVVLTMDLQNQLDIVQNSPRSVSNLKVHNSITVGVLDSTVKQWVHMVCGLWTSGTRCPNVDTMSAFDVSEATHPRPNVVCSMCNRPGGSCIQCRVINCSVRFHPWCAHQKGLLQSEVEGVDNENVGFYGRCILHANHPACESGVNPMDTEMGCPEEKESTCTRTEGYKGRKRDGFWHNLYGQSRGKVGCSVPQEQLNAWIHINGQKSCTQGLPKLPTSIESDCRKEYARYKQAKGWKHLVVYKSGIHALGLYTSRFISRGEMVVEYVGEIVGLRVADKRENEYQSGRKLQYKSACYFFRIDKDHIIDATCKGGIARFVNHSCLPNCVAKVISVRNEKKVVFYAERDIYPGEEITYDYHFNHEDDGKKIPCFCNSKNCRRYLN